MSDPDEWLTATEAARRLGISERQARRDIARASEADRTPPQVRPGKVRWAAIRPAWMSEASGKTGVRMSEVAPGPEAPGADPAPAGGDRGPIGAESPSGLSETCPVAVSEPCEPSGESGKSADPRDRLIAHLEGEVAFLRARLEAAERAAHEERILARDRQQAALPVAPEPERDTWLARLWGIFVQRD